MLERYIHFADGLPLWRVTFAVAVVYNFYVVYLRLRKAYFSPLSRLPGPWHAHLTSRPLRWAIIRGRRCHFVESLHKIYGPVVRVGPDEVCFADAASSKEIHGPGSRYLKLYINIGPTQNLFSMADPKEHNIRRRMYARGLTQTSLRARYEAQVRERASLAIEKIKGEALAGGADLVKWFMLMANDIICLLTLGDGSGLLEHGHRLAESRVLTAKGLHMSLAIEQFGVWLYWPGLVTGLLLTPISSYLNDVFLTGLKLYRYGQKAVKAAREPESDTFFAHALRDSKTDNVQVAKAKAGLTDAEIAVDAAGFQLAGADTVATTLIFLLYEVLQRPELQQQLEEEVAEISGEISDAACERLPLLNAVIDEALRLHGAAPTALRRVTPNGGATLAGYYIPERTIVTTQAWSLHRNPDVWENPEIFDPSRWLPGSKEAGRGAEAFMAFGTGTRGCAGVSLARMELRITSALFFLQCAGAKLKASVKPAGMVVVDRFNTYPVSKKCEVTLS